MAGPSSVAHTLQSPEQVVRNMDRLRHEEMPSWNGIAALRNLIDDTQPEVQQRVVEAGAAASIIATMQAWPDHAGIQVCGAGTLVRVAEVDEEARRAVLEAGGLFELAAAVERLSRPEHLDTDGELLGKHIVHKSNFARDCLLKVAGKRTDLRNRKHIDAAIAGGLDPSLFGKLDPKVRAPRWARPSLPSLASPRLALPCQACPLSLCRTTLPIGAEHAPLPARSAACVADTRPDGAEGARQLSEKEGAQGPAGGARGTQIAPRKPVASDDL
jgi:hypothetical protein